MLCNTTSIYPNGVDPMIFFHDNDIEKVEIINEYEKLIAQGKYDEANAFINQQEGIYGYFADFFNAIENRIFNLQEYLLSKPLKEQPFIYYNELKNDIATELHVFDDTDIEEDINSIIIFSDDNEEKDLLSNYYLMVIDEEEEPPDQLMVGNDTIWI